MIALSHSNNSRSNLLSRRHIFVFDAIESRSFDSFEFHIRIKHILDPSDRFSVDGKPLIVGKHLLHIVTELVNNRNRRQFPAKNGCPSIMNFRSTFLFVPDIFQTAFLEDIKNIVKEIRLIVSLKPVTIGKNRRLDVSGKSRRDHH